MRLIHLYSVASDNQKQIKYHKSRQNKHRRAWIDAEPGTLFTAATMSLSPHICDPDNNMMGVMMRSRRSRPDRSDHACHNRRRRGLREGACFPQRAGKRNAETSTATIPSVGGGGQKAAAWPSPSPVSRAVLVLIQWAHWRARPSEPLTIDLDPP